MGTSARKMQQSPNRRIFMKNSTISKTMVVVFALSIYAINRVIPTIALVLLQIYNSRAPASAAGTGQAIIFDMFIFVELGVYYATEGTLSLSVDNAQFMDPPFEAGIDVIMNQ